MYVKAAKEYGLAPVYWDNGGTGSGKEESGLFNHATGDYLNNAAEIVEVMKKGHLYRRYILYIAIRL